jgi:uncharacterized protein with HEPN domain
MNRDPKIYLEDILESIGRIEKYTQSLTQEQFENDTLVFDGTLRNPAIIGEAAKKIPDSIRKKHSEIEWKKIAGLRDIIIHEYFEMDHEIIWDIVKNKLPILKKQIRGIA